MGMPTWYNPRINMHIYNITKTRRKKNASLINSFELCPTSKAANHANLQEKNMSNENLVVICN